MPQKPISEMSHKPGRMSEDSDYTLTEMKAAILAIQNILENKHDTTVVANELEKKATKEELRILIGDYEKRVVNQPCIPELIMGMAVLATKIDAIKNTLSALGAKLDTEDVTNFNLDTNYESTIKNTLD